MTQQNNPNVVQAWQEVTQKEAKPRPWLAALFLQKGNQLFARFVDFYARLTAVNLQTRRRLAVGVGTAALMLALSSAPTPAYAANITVGAGCTLVQAIQSANTDASVGSCTAGTAGLDIINLPLGGTYSYTTAFGTQAALPDITTPITITANGATIQRTGVNPMRIIRVDAGGNLTLNNATITGGTVGNPGGGGILNFGTITLNNSTVRNNTASYGGGGILNRGTTTLNNSTVSDNTASYGGGIFNDGGTTTLNNSTVSGNTADNGGGIYNYNSANGNCAATPALTVNNSTVSGNTATSGGGGIYNLKGVAEIIHSTITGNTASANRGAGVRSRNDSLTCTRVGGSIIAGNLTGGDVAATNTDQRFSSLGHNLIGTNGANVDFALEFTATGDIRNNVAPGLGTLADNGGPTLTHALVTGSPAIDLAPSAACENGVLTSIDQRGAARNIDGDNAASANECDAGAIEHNSLQIPTELRFIGNCGGADLSGNQAFSFTGGTVNLNVTAANGLKCISVGQFAANHPNATGSPGNPGIATGQWWRINGNIDSGFTVNVTLPFASAGADTRACKWLDGLGAGAGWDCGDDADNDEVPSESVTRLNYTGGFSDWAVGDEVGPTAVTNLTQQTTTPTSNPLPVLLATLLATLTNAWLWARRPRRSTFPKS